MWFETLTGFHEESPQQVRENISINGRTLKSRVNGKIFSHGILEIPNLEELRNQILLSEIPTGKLTVSEIIENVQHLHRNKSNENALFQVASQFNLLEMVSPDITPEHGVGEYEYDLTQGPSCAIAAGAGTIYRNYFVDINGQIGQSADNQIDCLSEIGDALGNSNNHLWKMVNGYALVSKKGLVEISKKLKLLNVSEIDNLRKLLRIGIQWDTEVTITDYKHTVSQAYCSALPVAYGHFSSELWFEFAQLILEASYEAVFCAGILNYLRTGNNTLYLTFIGGGVFGNKIEWIINAINRSINIYKHIELDIVIVSHRRSNKYVQELIKSI